MTGKPLGSLQVRTPTLFDGYLNRPDATAEAFEADGWYRTGDVAVIDDGGMHRIVGRESVDLIKSGGYRIGAGEIETALLGHPGVERGRRGRRCPTTTSASGSSRSWSVTPSRMTLIDMSPNNSRRTSGRARCGSWTRCRATRWARCSRRS